MHNFVGHYLRPLVLGFFTGVFLASLIGHILGSIEVLFLFLAAASFVGGIFAPFSRTISLTIAAFFLAVVFGFILTDAAGRSHEVKLPEAGADDIVAVAGMVVSEPDERDRDTRLTFRPDGSVGRLLLVLPVFPTYHYGDRLLITGKAERPRAFETDLGRVFDYPAHLAVRGVGLVMRSPKVELLDENRGSKIVAALFALKASFLNRLERVLPEPAAALLGGLVVGGKRSLGEIWQERLRRAGLVHIVVLSGYNLTIIGAAIASFFVALRLRRSLTLIFSALAIILFSIMVGGGASVLRAAIMALIVVLARLTGRTYEAGRALITAMIVMVAINPLILVNDIGFQLSCLATAGLVYGSPLVGRWFDFIPIRFGLRSAIATTVVAQLAVLPWLLLVMGQVPLYALITNVLVVPIVPLAMLLSAIIGIIGLLLPPLALLVAPLGYLLATYILTVTSIFSSLPGAGLAIKTFPFALVLLIYLGYFFLWHRAQLKLTKK